MPESYVPRAEPALVIWFNNFQIKFTTYALTVGFVAADVTNVQNDYATLAWTVNLVEVFKAEAKERVEYKDTLAYAATGTLAPAVPTIPTIAPPATIAPPGILPRVQATIARIKAHPNYTLAMGQDLGIVAPAAPVPDDKDKPILTASAQPDSDIVIKWNKGIYDGVSIESQRNNETTWAQIGMDTSSPYLDSRPPLAVVQAEVRRYRARYFKNDTPTGGYSDIVTITTIP